MLTKSMEGLWYNPKEAVGYTGISKLAKAANVSVKEAKKWLSNQLAYSLNRPMRKRFPTRKYIVSGIDRLWQMDLMEMIPYASINNDYRYILTCVDVFSRYARAVALKRKSSKYMLTALSYMLKDVQPKAIQTDLGKEFYNTQIKSLFKHYGIHHYSVFSQYKAALVERFNKTLRTRLTKFFTKQGDKQWINVLPKLIYAYNHSQHRGLGGKKPIDVLEDDNHFREYFINNKPKAKYKIGQYVRISRISTTPFIKNFDNNWSDEVFKISEINTRQTPVMYVLRDEEDVIIQGKFYEQELQVLPEKPSVYRIKSILKSKGRGQYKQYLVDWHGYSKPSWILTSQLFKE